jgi:tripartite-type tricarboxylate transporter receptor subunit TctC
MNGFLGSGGASANTNFTAAFLLTALLAIAASLFIADRACAQSAADFYRGQTIRLIVGFGPGGGHDANARLLARVFGHYIPGAPNVLVQNMPGASSLKAVQYLDNGAPTDGTAIAIFNSGLMMESLIKPEEFPIDLNNYAWIGSLSQEIRVCYVRADSGIKTWNDMLQSPRINFGETGRGSASYVDSGILKDIFGVKVKTILGYADGSAEKELAIERGELDGECVSFSSIPKDWTRNHKITIILRGSILTLADMPADTPYIVDLTNDPEKKALIKFLLSPSVIGRPFIASKSVPADRVRALQEAFNASAKDSQLLADAEKLQLPVVGTMTGQEAAAYVAETSKVSSSLIAAARKIAGQ